jgi:hypothetical protein
VSDTDQRSMSLAEVVEAYNAGTITQETFIWTDGMEDWKPLAEVDSVVSALHSSAGAGQTGAASPAPAPSLAFEPPPAAAPAFAASAPVQAFAAPEPKRAAVKREARGRDLFGTSDDVQTSATASASAAAGLSPAVDDGKLTGQRNESSVLFSLAVLTKSGDQPTASAQPTRNKEDSGLIDLKALAAKAESMRPAAPAHAHDAFSSPLGAAPLPLGSPLGAVTPSGDEGQPKSKLPLILGGAFGALVLIVLSVVVTVKLVGSGAPAPSASAAASSAPSATAADTASASATTAASTPPPTASASSSAVATKGGKPGPGVGGMTPHGGPGGKTPATTGATPSAAATTPPVVVKKSGGDCGCNGDLMCLMQCSTKH